MSKSITLNTRTINFLELLGNGRQYTIPPYQRDYSWVEEQWDDLWNDILALRAAPQERHYMGTFVVEATSDRDFLVIDGQQRLATLSLLALAIIQRLELLPGNAQDRGANRERAASLRARFIGEKDPASLMEKSKLGLNETDNPFFQDYLVQLRTPPNPKKLPRSNRLLWDCFQWFGDKLEKIDQGHLEGQKLAELLSETIARQLLFILIQVDDDLNAYTIFETLNARGIELSSTDLLKNYLFSRVKHKLDLKSLQRKWQQLLGTVRQEDFPKFLRYHLLCEHSSIRSNRLFRIVRDQVQTQEQVFELMKALDHRAELFSALGDAEHEFWIEHPECKPFIRERILLKDQQSVPLLFAAWEKLKKKDFHKVLRLINVFTFRFTSVCGLNTNELEPLYHRVAKGIIQGDAQTPMGVFELLRPSYVSDERFQRDFEVFEVSTSGASKHLAKYILCRLEKDLCKRDVNFETDPGSIEHILPENPLAAWEESIREEEWPKQVCRIGNLTLLEAKINREIENSLFPEKVKLYATSRYALTQAIVEEPPEEWTIAQIHARQERLARRAVQLWRADFD